MQIQALKANFLEHSAELLVIPVWSTPELKLGSLKHLDPVFQKRLTKATKSFDFKANLGQVIVVAAPADMKAEHILLLGMGARSQNLESWREAAGAALNTAKRFNLQSLAFDLTGQTPAVAGAVTEAALLAAYTFETYKVANGQKIKTLDLVTNDGKNLAGLKKSLEKSLVVMDAVTLVRDMVNTPAQEMTPDHMADAAAAVAQASGKLIKVKIMGREGCKKLNMGAYLAVAQGSDHEPKFIHLSYTSPRPTKKTLALVGKGVTFDSGGLSLKPADAMMHMKTDMAGGAAVIGLFATLSHLKPRVNIHGIIPATENMVSGLSVHPGDIVRASNGTTIEILNTDAEGRLTLADAITYVLKEKPDAIVDLATLTGACLVALGEEITGLMTNNKQLGSQVMKAAQVAGEKMWELPLEERYREQIISDTADLRNIATSRYGGVLTAGLFIREFVNNTPWVHLDIAGPAYAERPMASYLGKGATGHGVRTLVELVENF